MPAAAPRCPTVSHPHGISPSNPCPLVLQVRATGGDTRLGGEDFDAATTKFLETQFLRTHPKCTVDARGRRRLIAAAERAKRHLSSQTTAEVRACSFSIRCGEPRYGSFVFFLGGWAPFFLRAGASSPSPCALCHSPAAPPFERE